MKIIPAIDIIDGKCVRLSKGDYDTKIIYNENPLEVAKEFADFGIKYVHVVDLDGAKSKRIVNQDILESIVKKTDLKVDFGGGIKSNEDIKIAFESGASQITGGSIAVKNPSLFLEWIERYGSDKIILGADCKNRKIATEGWLKNSDVDILDFIKSYEAKGIRNVISTDIAKDGMLEGPSYELYKEILTNSDVNLIASGGVSSIEDVRKLAALDCEGVIIGKAIYEGRITLEELSQEMWK